MAYLSVPKIFRHLTFLHLSSPFIVDNCYHISNLSFAITYIYIVLKTGCYFEGGSIFFIIKNNRK